MHRRFTAVFRWLFLIIILVGMFGQPRGTQLANAAPISGRASSETRGSVYSKLKEAPASRTVVSASVQNSTSLVGSDVIILPATNSSSSNDIGLIDSNEDLNTNGTYIGVEPYVTPSFPTYSFNGGLTIEPIAAYNLIVDSNVLSPSSYGPSAATLGAQFCNTSGSALTNVWAYIGDFNADNDLTPGETGDLTPGTYPIHNATTDAAFNSRFPHLATPPTAVDYGDPSRFYALEHEAGSASDTVDASRYIGTLAAEQCKTHYWLVSYPRKAMINGSRKMICGSLISSGPLLAQQTTIGPIFGTRLPCATKFLPWQTRSGRMAIIRYPINISLRSSRY